MADMENALWGADRVVSNEEAIQHTFVTAMVKGDISTKAFVSSFDCPHLLSHSPSDRRTTAVTRARTKRAWTSVVPTCTLAATTVQTPLHY